MNHAHNETGPAFAGPVLPPEGGTSMTIED